MSTQVVEFLTHFGINTQLNLMLLLLNFELQVKLIPFRKINLKLKLHVIWILDVSTIKYDFAHPGFCN